ncbi:hypothetical protein H8959_019100 [Pygathrix nigripes]
MNVRLRETQVLRCHGDTCLRGLNLAWKLLARSKQHQAWTDCTDFHAEKLVNAAAGGQGGTEASVEVFFEPSHLGETKGILILSSLAGGEYIIPLFGMALPPKPQGPFPIRAGYSIIIPFKNVFYHMVTFSIIVDNPAFTVHAVESVRPKKINNITVSFEGNPSGSKIPITTKLIVSCPPGKGSETGIKWVYYLKGITLSGNQGYLYQPKAMHCLSLKKNKENNKNSKGTVFILLIQL